RDVLSVAEDRPGRHRLPLYSVAPMACSGDGSPHALPSGLFCLRALKVGANRERSRIILLHVGQRSIDIEIADVAQDEPLRIRTLCHASDDSGERLVRIVGVYADGKMHEQNVGAFGKPRKSWISAVLVRAKDDGHALRFHPIGQRGKIPMWYTH